MYIRGVRGLVGTSASRVLGSSRLLGEELSKKSERRIKITGRSARNRPYYRIKETLKDD